MLLEFERFWPFDSLFSGRIWKELTVQYLMWQCILQFILRSLRIDICSLTSVKLKA